MNKPDANGRNPMHLTDDEFLNDREVPETMCEKCNELKQLLGAAIIRLQQLGDKEFIFPATPGEKGTAATQHSTATFFAASSNKDVGQGDAASAAATPEMVIIWSGEHRAWWRDNGAGYTTVKDVAGVYTKEDALRRTVHCGPEKQIELQPVPGEPVALPEEPDYLESQDVPKSEFIVRRSAYDELRAAAIARIAELEQELAEAQEKAISIARGQLNK